MNWVDWLIVAAAFVCGGLGGGWLTLAFVGRNWGRITAAVDRERNDG